MDNQINDKTIIAYIAVTLPMRASLQRAKDIVDVVRDQRDVIGASFVIHKDHHFSHQGRDMAEVKIE